MEKVLRWYRLTDVWYCECPDAESLTKSPCLFEDCVIAKYLLEDGRTIRRPVRVSQTTLGDIYVAIYE